MTRRRLPTIRQIDAALRFLPQLEQPGQEFATSEFDGSYTVWNSNLLDSFIDCLYENGFVFRDFDWGAWEEGRERSEDPGWIAGLDLETLCKLFTAHVRNDRFCGGHMASMCSHGYMQAMLRRLAEIRGETRSGATPHQLRARRPRRRG